MAGTESGAPRSVQDLLRVAKALDAELAGAGFRPPAAPAAASQQLTEAAPPDPLTLFDALVTDTDLSAATRTLFRDGHYARAVEEAYKFLNSAVRGRAGESTRDGQALMLHVFDPDAPVLRLSPLRTQSQKDEQSGYRFVFAGVMTGIRNPRAHEYALRDDADVALEMLVTANHLMRAVRRSTRPRRIRRPRVTGAATP
jgi:uncharacterized protein (TIGR02391 family)